MVGLVFWFDIPLLEVARGIQKKKIEDGQKLWFAVDGILFLCPQQRDKELITAKKELENMSNVQRKEYISIR